jgi:hypothetical protein
MATISNTPRPGYVWDATDNVWYPIGVGGHGHPDYITQATAVNPTIIDAKGDIITATAADTPARLAVGNNGESLVADSSTSTGLRWQGDYAAGKNKVINGDFYWNQRNFTTGTGSEYVADRMLTALSGATGTSSRESFTVGQTAVPGNPVAYGKMVITTGNDFARLIHRIEDVSTFAGQTATLSFYAKGVNPTTAGKLNVRLQQQFGTGGSTAVATAEQDLVLTTSFTKYTYTFSVPSISGTTVGAGNYLSIDIGQLSNASTQGWTLEVAQIQLEAGSVATAFQTATGTLQGELAACQRYYQIAGDTIYEIMDGGYMVSGNVAYPSWIFAVPMRTTPTGTVVGSWAVSGVGQPTLQASQQRGFSLRATSNATGAYYFHSNTTYYLTFSAEL